MNEKRSNLFEANEIINRELKESYEMSKLMEEYEIVANASRPQNDLTSMTPDVLNRVALAQHLLFEKPRDALRTHLIAMEMNIEFSAQLYHGDIDFDSRNKSYPTTNHQEEDKEQERGRSKTTTAQEVIAQQVSFDIIVALCDIGSCYWSISYFEESSKMYLAALAIYHLMKIDQSFISVTINNRLNILYPHMKSAEKNLRVQAIIASHQSHTEPFSQVMEITKSAISNVTI